MSKVEKFLVLNDEDFNFAEFFKDRLESLRSLDFEKIRSYMKKYEIQSPVDSEIFWLGVHKARLILPGLTEEEREMSRKWIQDRGYSL